MHIVQKHSRKGVVSGLHRTHTKIQTSYSLPHYILHTTIALLSQYPHYYHFLQCYTYSSLFAEWWETSILNIT